jgi:hypothetical protein
MDHLPIRYKGSLVSARLFFLSGILGEVIAGIVTHLPVRVHTRFRPARLWPAMPCFPVNSERAHTGGGGHETKPTNVWHTPVTGDGKDGRGVAMNTRACAKRNTGGNSLELYCPIRHRGSFWLSESCGRSLI